MHGLRFQMLESARLIWSVSVFPTLNPDKPPELCLSVREVLHFGPARTRRIGKLPISTHALARL
jgi:hypothetical protein